MKTSASKIKKTRTNKVVKTKNSNRDFKIRVKVKGKPVKKTTGQKLFMLFLVVLPFLVGLVSTLVTADMMTSFNKLNQPPLAPPAWLFPVAWTILYILMGVALLLIFRCEPKDESERNLQNAEIVVFFVQLFFNFMWTILFFRLEVRWFAFGWLVVMWAMILALIVLCAKNCKPAAWCLVPYVLWCTFAMYLNMMIAILN